MVTPRPGFAVLLLGVAASSSFATGTDQQLRPGQWLRLAGYVLTYRAPGPAMDPEKLSFGAVVDVSRDGSHVATLRPARQLYPAAGRARSGIVGRYFSGEQTSEIGLDASFGKDLWVAVQPDFESLQPAVKEAERRFATAAPETQAFIIGAILRRWADLKAPVTFRAFVRTGVSWMWSGVAFLGLGALVAAWPSARRARARSGTSTESGEAAPSGSATDTLAARTTSL